MPVEDAPPDNPATESPGRVTLQIEYDPLEEENLSSGMGPEKTEDRTGEDWS